MSETLVRLQLPDGSVREVEKGTTLREVATSIGARLAKAAVAAVVDDEVQDLTRVAERDAEIRFLLDKDPESLDVLRHSSAHLMAQAVKRLFPEAKFGVGPVIENGFYYDMVIDRTLTPEDLEKIEKEMKKISSEKLPIERKEWSRNQAVEWSREIGDEFKEELISAIAEDEVISFYTQGGFTDLCTGPHVPLTSFIKHIKLLSVAGAYWRGDENRPMMQRIYGTSFFSKKELDAHLEWLEEVKKRDHRKLGKDLDLFFFHQHAPASPFFLPKGAVLYNLLQDYARELYEEFDYQEVVTPQILHSDLWRTSGHYDNYKDDMYFIDSDGGEYGVKPMNCPGHMLLFGSKVRSYRELPLRIADFGRLHRFERSGVIRGLTRVRSFAQDDAHIFLAPEMIGDEIRRLFQMMRTTYEGLGLEFPPMALGTRPEKSVGSADLWEKAEKILHQALVDHGEPFTVNEGDGAFYGPKIDFPVKDALGREWQLSTLQLDFNLPERFDLKYSAADGTTQRPVVIHRAILGSLERFLGVYIEHTGGNFPAWLAPVQVRVLSMNEEVAEYARQVGQTLKEAGFRVEVDQKSEKLGAKIRAATLLKIPYLLIVGAREAEAGSVAVRVRGQGDRGACPLDDFVAELRQTVDARR